MNLKLRLFASVCLGVLLTIAMVFGIASAFAVIVKPIVDAQIIAYMGPTGDPTGQGFYDKALPILGEYNVGKELEFIQYPAGLRPATGPGTLTLDASLAQGVPNAISVITQRDKPTIFLLGGSQSAVALSEVKKYFDQHPELAPPAQDLTFLLIANPDRPNGGLLARFPGLHIPILDITFNGATPNDQYTTYDINWAYDGFSNFPRYPLDILSTLNALMGTKYQHGVAPDPFDPNNDVSVSVVGNTTYYTLMPAHLPLFRPMLDAGWGPLVSVIEPLTKVWVNAGYDNNDPRSNPGIAESAKVFIPLQNIVTALLLSPGAIAEGISTIPESVRQMMSGKPVTNVQNVVTSTVNEVGSLVNQVTAITGTVTNVQIPAVPSLPGQPVVSGSSIEQRSAGNARPKPNSGITVGISPNHSWKPGDGLNKAVKAINQLTHGLTDSSVASKSAVGHTSVGNSGSSRTRTH